MRTSKCVVVLLVVALVGVAALTAAAGQDKPAASAGSPQPKTSNTRFASCLVRITIDPVVIPLNERTIESLLYSSTVVSKAARKVFSLDMTEDMPRQFIRFELLDVSWTPMPRGTRSDRQNSDRTEGYDEERLRQLERVYGLAYTQQPQRSPDQSQKSATDSAGGVGGDSGARESWTRGHEAEMARQPGETEAVYRARLARLRSRYAAGAGPAGRGTNYYGAPAVAQPGAGAQQSVTVRLQVSLPDATPPLPALADEFLKELVDNLQDSLGRAYVSYIRDIEDMLASAKEQRQRAQRDLDGAGDDAERIRKQLQTVVDLSPLTAQTPLSAAIDILRKAVDPPLNIVVLWRDLCENLSVEPTSPINLDGMPRVKLETMLDLLAKGLAPGEGGAMWRIRGDVLVIGTAATLGRPAGGSGQPQVETDTVNLGGQRSELVRKVQALELDLAGLNARQEATEKQIALVREEGKKRLAEDTVTRELEGLLQASRRSLDQLKQAAAAGQISQSEVSQAEANVAKARIELARRQEELTKQAGSGQLEEFTREMGRLVIDKAEKEAQLQIVRRQLDEVQRQLAQALAFDPEAARQRTLQETTDIADRRIMELQVRLSNLQPPRVTMIGN